MITTKYLYRTQERGNHHLLLTVLIHFVKCMCIRVLYPLYKLGRQERCICYYLFIQCIFDHVNTFGKILYNSAPGLRSMNILDKLPTIYGDVWFPKLAIIKYGDVWFPKLTIIYGDICGRLNETFCFSFFAFTLGNLAS